MKLNSLFLTLFLFSLWAENTDNTLMNKKSLRPPTLSYTLPGIIGLREGEWVGHDHLLNLTSDLQVNADIVKPQNLDVPFTLEEIKEEVLAIFRKEGFVKISGMEQPQTPLPYFNMLVMIQKIPGGFAATIQGRLFEEVNIKRVALPQEVLFQAITWEKESMIVSSTESFKSDLLANVDEIAKLFIERYNYFERQEAKLRSQ